MSASDKALAVEWFDKAEHDLLNVRNNLAAAEVPTDTVCFHCHQAAEKYLKGFLVWHAVPPDRTHDLEDLLQSCAGIDPRLGALRPLVHVSGAIAGITQLLTPMVDRVDQHSVLIRDVSVDDSVRTRDHFPVFTWN